MAKKPDTKTQNKPSTEDLEETHERDADSIVQAIEKNRVILIGGAIAVLVIGGFILIQKQLGKQRHLEASLQFTEAATARNIEALDKVVSTYQGTVSAGNALLAKADILIDQGKSQDAITALDKMAADFVDHPRHAQAYYMLANIYHKAEDYEKASSNYNKVIQIQTDAELTPISRIRLGDIALAQGDPEKARQNYEESYVKYPGNPFVTTAERRIALLKIGNPPLVDPPKKPEPEEDDKDNPEEPKKPGEDEKKETPDEKDDESKE